MCKKLFIAAIAVVVGLAVVKSTWVGSHLRMRAQRAFDRVKKSVPPEQEIARLRMELKNLERDDDKHFDKVARMVVQVEKMDRELAEIRKNLGKEETRLSQLRDQFNDSREFVLHNDRKYTKDDLRRDALGFKAAEENLKSKEANHEAKKKHLALERKKLTELRTNREQMATELTRLETALAEERHSQAASESTIDDSGYRRLKKDMESVRERIDILKNKRILRGEIQVPAQTEQARERDVQADKYLESRFGKAKEVVDNNKE